MTETVALIEVEPTPGFQPAGSAMSPAGYANRGAGGRRRPGIAGTGQDRFSRRGGGALRDQGHRHGELGGGEGDRRGELRGHARLAAGRPHRSRCRPTALTAGSARDKAAPDESSWAVALHREADPHTALGTGIVIATNLVLTCHHVAFAADGTLRPDLMVAFPRAPKVAYFDRRKVRQCRHDGMRKAYVDLVVLELVEPVPATVTPAARLRCRAPNPPLTVPSGRTASRREWSVASRRPVPSSKPAGTATSPSTAAPPGRSAKGSAGAPVVPGVRGGGRRRRHGRRQGQGSGGDPAPRRRTGAGDDVGRVVGLAGRGRRRRRPLGLGVDVEHRR